ncbi:ribosomal-protein-alanine acetyltransferase [Halolamina pelagica]|uniref:Ribosomal-protein-alanine acetyltransferase n=1 Tax=Halolamina pelagica TaxID=699431 RepID=A0A0P7GQS1_9EURY|nr:GNAT family N-acetyltransferase [Halolamina pelagica]KPN31562.1 ribosomal-protein-alanine acetyltransferase [Halolamina pelagica]
MVTIERDTTGAHVDDCHTLARGLDRGFNEAGLDAMAETLPEQTQYLAFDGGELLGFASIDEHGPTVAELAWLAVRPAAQGAGVGSRLLDGVADRLAADGVELLTVKTLAATADSEHYARVRSFYEAAGFRHVETIDPYPEWEPGNPCAIYVKPLAVD